MTKLEGIVFCDDIRFESNGKLIVIGIYGADLLPGALPQTLQVSIWTRFRDLPEGKFNFSFQISYNLHVLHKGSVPVDIPKGQIITHVNLVGVPVELKEPGELLFTLDGIPNLKKVEGSLRVVQPSNFQFTMETSAPPKSD